LINMKTKSHTFHKTGKWVEKVTLSTILVCTCGGKYIKTRPHQLMCVKCMAKVA
jgi:hypothetical protein